MSVIAVASAQGAPGASTVALCLAATWPDEAVRLVEADADGGVIVTRFALPHEPGLVTFASSPWSGAPTLDAAEQQLPGGLTVVAAPPGVTQARACLASAAAPLAEQLDSDPTLSIVDVGRARPESAPLLAVAETTLLVVRSRADEIAAAAGWLAAHTAADHLVRLIVVNDGVYSPTEIAGALEVELAGVVPRDPAGARNLYGSGWSWAVKRSLLVRGCRSIAEHLASLREPSRHLNATVTQ